MLVPVFIQCCMFVTAFIQCALFMPVFLLGMHRKFGRSFGLAEFDQFCFGSAKAVYVAAESTTTNFDS